MSLRKNDVIDYFDNRRICSGLVLEIDERRVRILSEQGKETKLSPNRILTGGTYPEFPTSGTRDDQVASLKTIAATREEIKNRIDLNELWEVVGQEIAEIQVQDLAELLFGSKPDTNCSAALLRAISEDRIYFRIRPDKIDVNPPDRVEQALIQRERDAERMEFLAASTEFVRRVKVDSEVTASDAPDGFIPMLEEAALHGKDWITFKRVREVFSNAGVGSDLDPFTVLVKLGLWSEDENLRLRAEKVPVEFGADAEADALEVAKKPLPLAATQMTDEEIIAVDSVFTRDVDDALSLSYEGEDLVIGIHITDVSHFVEHNSALDLAARERATSLYLPDLTIPMLPPAVSERAASLAVGEIRPAISMMLRSGSDLSRKDFRIFPSVVRVSKRLSYEEADERIRDPETNEAKLFTVAQALREGRAAAGALIFRDPELAVRVEEDGSIDVTMRDRETPAQILVSEMMILANSLFALFLKEHGLPGIFRIQPPPTERIDLGDEYDPVASYRCRKTLVRSDIGVDPGPHSTLGLNAYATATSPLRRYPDLLLQRQIKSFLERGMPLLDRNELEKILVETSYPLERAVLMERERQRYFLLKYLQQRKDKEFKAIVLQRFPKFHLVQIADLAFNAPLNTPNSLSLNPYDQALVRVEKANPREDKLSLSLVKLL